MNDLDQARVYLYKVEIVYNGVTIPLNGEENIIRVVLPPPNMSFAHRKIINRTMCLDLSKDGESREINKYPGGHYSCSYNGLGASSLSVPWFSADTVFDIGGDLLIDRFELGCNWTRGNIEDWEGSTMPDDLSTYSGTTGCVAKSYHDELNNSPLDEYPLRSSSSGLPKSEFEDMKRARKGDCIGTWVTKLSKDKSSAG